MSAATTAALVLCVWLIYVADRCFDAWRDRETATETPRHRFYRRHWRWVAPVAVGALGFTGWVSLTQLTRAVLRNGLLLSSGIVLYFLVVHLAPRSWSRWWPKEMVVAILFTIGTCFPVWGITGRIGLALLPPVILFAALCWLNCAAIERWEGDRNEPASMPRAPHLSTYWLGRRVSKVAWAITIGAVVAMSLRTTPLNLLPLYEAAGASAIVLLVLDAYRAAVPVDALRVLADAALLSPLPLLLLLGWHA